MGVELGSLRIDVLSDGEFRLDGGAMFGVVPKPLWERLSPPDELNRITLGMHPLLIRAGGKTILVDAGIGRKEQGRVPKMFGVGAETVGTDAGQAGGFDPPFPNHTIMHGAGKFGLASLCNLDQLPATGSVVIAAPLKIVDGSGSPLRVLAIAPA